MRLGPIVGRRQGAHLPEQADLVFLEEPRDASSAWTCPSPRWSGDRDRQLLDPDRGRLELRRSGLRISGVDRQEVRRNVVLEMERHERETGPKRLVEADRDIDLATAGHDPHALALGE